MCTRRLSRGVSVVVTSVALAGISELHSSTFDCLGKYFCYLVMSLAAGIE